MGAPRAQGKRSSIWTWATLCNDIIYQGGYYTTMLEEKPVVSVRIVQLGAEKKCNQHVLRPISMSPSPWMSAHCTGSSGFRNCLHAAGTNPVICRPIILQLEALDGSMTFSSLSRGPAVYKDPNTNNKTKEIATATGVRVSTSVLLKAFSQNAIENNIRLVGVMNTRYWWIREQQIHLHISKMYGRLQITAILSRPYCSRKIRFNIMIYIIMSSVKKEWCQPLTALAGVSAPFARYCLKITRPIIMLPMLQMTEQ